MDDGPFPFRPSSCRPAQQNGSVKTPRACLLRTQAMLENSPRFVGEGRVRRVTLVEHEGRTLAIKELKDPRNLRLHRLEVVTMDVVSFMPCPLLLPAVRSRAKTRSLWGGCVARRLMYVTLTLRCMLVCMYSVVLSVAPPRGCGHSSAVRASPLGCFVVGVAPDVLRSIGLSFFLTEDLLCGTSGVGG